MTDNFSFCPPPVKVLFVSRDSVEALDTFPSQNAFFGLPVLVPILHSRARVHEARA